MNKKELLTQIIVALESVHKNAIDATKLAHETATHGETVAENKYDTFGLEASYLAHGQAKRVAECASDLAAYKKLTPQNFIEQTPISQGALIYIKNVTPANDKSEQILFLGPAAGGLKLTFRNENIMLITTAAPIGKVLTGRCVGDEVELTLGSQIKVYEITAIY